MLSSNQFYINGVIEYELPNAPTNANFWTNSLKHELATDKKIIGVRI